MKNENTIQKSKSDYLPKDKRVMKEKKKNFKKISEDRKEYLKNIKIKKFTILFFQVAILISFIAIWEILGDLEVIDTFIMSQPSRIFNTFMNLTSNDLLMHIGVTAYETVVGFLIGTLLGTIIAIILWWSDYLSAIFEPYLVVLNSLPKVALRTNNYNLGWCWYSCNYCNGSSDFSNSNYFRKSKWFF